MSTLPTRPFVGLRPYTFADAPIFFERRGEAEQLRDTILAHRVVMLFGDSGNGKSSLINAGLLPLLVRGKAGSFQPERVTIGEDFTRLGVETGPIAGTEDDAAGSIWAGPGGTRPEACLMLDPGDMLAELKAKLNALAPAARPKVLILFDQFEELHTRLGGRAAFSSRHSSARTEAEQASRREAQLNLARTIDDWIADEELKELPVKFLFAFREEYLVKVQSLIPTLRFEAEGFRLPSMRTNRFEAVIKGPFQKGSPFGQQGDFFVGHSSAIARAFESRSLGEGQNILSEIQVVCGELWDNAPGLRERFERSEPMDHVAAIDDILANFFQRVIRGWGPLADPAIAVLCELVTDDKTRDIVSDSTLHTTLCEGEAPATEAGGQVLYPRELLDEALAHLLKNKIVFRSERGGVTFYDIAGESIIPWISEERRERILKAQTSKYEAEARKNAQVMALEKERKELITQNERSAKIQSGMKLGISVLGVAGVVFLALAGVAFKQREKANHEWKLAGKALGKSLEAQKQTEEKAHLAEDAKIISDRERELAITKAGELTTKLRELSDINGSLVPLREANEALRKENEQILAGIKQFEIQINQVLPGTSVAAADFKAFAQEIKASATRITETISQGSIDIEAAAKSIDKISETLRIPATTVLANQSEYISDIKFIPGDPAMLATGSMGNTSEGSLRLQTLDGKEVAAFSGDSARIRSSPDGKWLVSLPGGRKHLLLHDRTDSWKPRVIDSGGNRDFNSAAFSPDGKWLALAVGSSLQLWDWHSPPSFQKFWEDSGTFGDRVSSVVFSPDGRRFVAGSDDKNFAIFDINRTGTPAPKVMLWRKESVQSPLRKPVFSADGRWVLATNNGMIARLYDTHDSRDPGLELKHESKLTSGEFSPDGKWIATATVDGAIHLWGRDPSGSVTRLSVGKAHTGKPRTLAWRPDGSVLATAGDDAVVYLWNALSFESNPEATPSSALRGHSKSIGTIEFSPDGRYLASGDDSGMVRLWNFGEMLAWQKGRFGTFGGPDDPKLKADEGLALIGKWDEADSLKPSVFLSEADRSTPPRARQLDPSARYIAMRWDYAIMPKKELRKRKLSVMNLRTGKVIDAQPVDWGPGLASGLLMHLSPGLAKELELGANGEAAVWVPPASILSVLEALAEMGFPNARPDSDIRTLFSETDAIDKQLGLPAPRTAQFILRIQAECGIAVSAAELLQGLFPTPRDLADLAK